MNMNNKLCIFNAYNNIFKIINKNLFYKVLKFIWPISF